MRQWILISSIIVRFQAVTHRDLSSHSTLGLNVPSAAVTRKGSVLVKRTSRRDPDYAFGQAMLTLRTTMGLTQAGLAEFLGISRYALGDWEAGESYPKVEHLKHFITLALQQQAFPAGHEAEEIRALWQLAHQRVQLDEYWLADLLPAAAQPCEAAYPISQPAHVSRRDWDDALSSPSFYGRESELELLSEWVVEDRSRIVGVLGLGGIGKSALSVNLMRQVADRFDVVIWRTLRDVPTCEALLDGYLQVLAPHPQTKTLTDLEDRLQLLLEYLRRQRALLVLDNLESILEEGEDTGRMRPGYEDYEKLLSRVGETEHQSCLVFTSREKPILLAPLEGNLSSVRSVRLSRLEPKPCRQLLAEKGITGTDDDRVRLVEAYEGNPLALKIVAQTIVDLFEGDIAVFLEQGEIIFGGIRALLAEQFDRLSALEQSVLVWLAIIREPSRLVDLVGVMVTTVSRGRVLDAVESLHRRSLIEPGQHRGRFTLHSVVQEYVTTRIVENAVEEIQRGNLEFLSDHGLSLAHSPEYVRQAQQQLIVDPILTSLRSIYRQRTRIEARLSELLEHLKSWEEIEQGYGPANLVVLLYRLRGNLRGVDLSQLVLRDVYLQDVEMQDARLINASILDSIFTETFDALTAVAVSATGEYWAVASRRGEIRIWETDGTLLRQAWRGHITTTWALAFSPDGQFLASGSNDGALKLWEAATGKLLWSSRQASDVNRLSFSPDGRMLASAVHNASVCLWDVARGTLLHTLPHPSPVAVVAWSPDGQRLASGDVAGAIRFWAVNHQEPTYPAQTLTQHASCADGLVFSPDGRLLASASWDGTVKLWEVSSGQVVQTLTGHTDRVGRVAWSPDGTLLASGSADQTILLWDVEQGSYRAALRGHDSHVYEIGFTPDSRSLLSSSRDGSLRVWDVETEQCVRVIHGYAASIYDVDWSPDSRRLVSGGTDLIVTLWDVDSGIPVQLLQEHTGVVRAVGWSPKGRWLTSSDTEYGVRLWDLSAGTNFRFLRHSDNSGNYMYNVAWSPDGNRLASGTHQRGVVIWDAMTGAEIRIGSQSPTWFPVVAWSPDGTRLAGAGVDGSISIWNVTDDTLEQQLIGHQSRVTCLAWSPDGTRLASGASGAEGGQLFAWDLQRGERIQSFVGHVNVVAAVAWESTGECLVSGGGQGILRWWDVETGERLWIRDAHDGAVQALRRSPDGTKLASCGDDGAIMLWDMSSGEHIQTLRRDRPYERLDITGIKGLTEAQKAMLYALGAVDNSAV